MKKMNDPGRPVMKPLADLTLLDRFLFACVMEDRGTMELVLSIILGEEIHLAEQPQAEREMRTVPWLRSIRLDVYSVDEESRVYNAEVQIHIPDGVSGGKRPFSGRRGGPDISQYPWNCAGGNKRRADRAASLHRAHL